MVPVQVTGGGGELTSDRIRTLPHFCSCCIGVTLVCALVSLFGEWQVPATTAMSGEISLRGQVLPVGGIKEKVISAHRAGIRKVILPWRNQKDVDADVPLPIKMDVEFVYAKTIWDVLNAAFTKDEKWSATRTAFESHL